MQAFKEFELADFVALKLIVKHFALQLPDANFPLSRLVRRDCCLHAMRHVVTNPLQAGIHHGLSSANLVHAYGHITSQMTNLTKSHHLVGEIEPSS